MKKLEGAASKSSVASTELATTSDEFNKMVKTLIALRHMSDKEFGVEF